MRRATLFVLGALVVGLLAVAPSAAAAPSANGFQTGFLDDSVFGGPWASLGFQRAADVGATIVRLRLDWSDVAPAGATKPSGFDATNPDDPRYNWTAFDNLVTAAIANGQTPIANIFYAPQWSLTSPGAGLPATVPDPAAFAQFALAAAQRYSGLTPGIPRVKYWEIWNEPNIGLYFEPQFVGGQPYSPSWYRDVVNRSYDAIKSVHADNFVIAGSTAPFYDLTPSTQAANSRWGPLGFMRALLCLTPELTPVGSGCPVVKFDAWSHHPYTEGGPMHTAVLPDDVSLGDLPKMKAVLDAAWSAGNIGADAPPQFWVTEFSWDSNPPDPKGVPMDLLQRWIPESMYMMWSDGVSVLTWFLLEDAPSTYQTGLYTHGATGPQDEPKPILQAFRFPFVAYRSAGGVRFWGRTPAGRSAPVAVEQEFLGGWNLLGTVQADAYGILQGRFDTSSRLPVRARTADLGETSVPFSLRMVPDRYFVTFAQQSLEPPPVRRPRPAIPQHWRP